MRMGLQKRLAAVLGVAVTVFAAPAQVTPHVADFQMRLTADDRVETGAFDEQGTLVWGERIVTSVLGVGGDTNFAGDPGFENAPGAFPAGYGLGLTIRRALREWDGLTFDGIAPEPLVLVKFFSQVPTPADDTPTPAFTVGAANGSGYFHHHLGYAFDAPAAVEGVFLLEVELWNGSAGNVVSEPLFVLFAQGAAALGEFDAAEAWVRTNLIGVACLADLAAPFGVTDLDDVNAFISAFLVGDAAADLVSPFGVTDIDDVNAFIDAFLAGCP